MAGAWIRRVLSPQPIELEVADADFKLRLLARRDYLAWRKTRAANQAYLQPFEPSWSPDALSRTTYLRQVQIADYEYQNALGGMMLMIHRTDNSVIGGINLRNVRRGVAQMGTLGYWIASDWGGQGRMTQAVQRMTEFGFRQIGLHRIEAACVPENEASARVLLRAGFEEEGFARGYLRIDGCWRDHRLFAIVAS